ncbi:MAG: tRNA glutamyl-Q(34) synthetase GluQRS [Pseudomonadales bacterium]|nr:tRNA glutamyl-Q(34) synthetase GluQRS [Pseudomonadales bacterium]
MELGSSSNPPYIGRFAPSPTGPLHFGSLVTALASYLDAKKNQGQWLVRMENIDPPREQPGADKLILQALEAHGLEWDSTVLFQSSRLTAYQEIIDYLLERDLAYFCHCSRQLLKEDSIYPGFCRNRKLNRRNKMAIRIRVSPERIQFEDEIQGIQSQQMDQEIGDFVIFRKDCLVAYQLAVSADDAYQKISKVVRGQDLLSSTSRQIYLLRTLHHSAPQYAHIPIITNTQGQKLSKQNLASPLDLRHRASNLYRALIALGQHPPKELATTKIETILHWAMTHWDIVKTPKKSNIPLDKIILPSSEP